MFDFLWQWKTGYGLYGEQGGESAHNGINKMKHRYQNVKMPEFCQNLLDHIPEIMF